MLTSPALTSRSESKEQNIALILLNHTCKIQKMSKTITNPFIRDNVNKGPVMTWCEQ